MNEKEEIIVTEESNVVEVNQEPCIYDLPEEEHKSNKLAVGFGVSAMAAAVLGGVWLWRRHKAKKAAQEEDELEEDVVEYEADDEDDSEDSDDDDSEEEDTPKSKK